MSAVISNCGTYRYRLERSIRPLAFDIGAPHVAWIMVNPSTVDATQDDATIRKVRGFTERMNGTGFTVGNLFAYRATDIRELRTAPYPNGPEDDFWLHQIIASADKVMVAWGPMAKLPKHLRHRFEKVMHFAAIEGQKLHCLGTANDGHPLHPLMQPYAAQIVEWKRP